MRSFESHGMKLEMEAGGNSPPKPLIPLTVLIELLEEFRFEVVGEQTLRVYGSDRLRDRHRSMIRQHKSTLLAILRGEGLAALVLWMANMPLDDEQRTEMVYDFEERAAISEFDGGLSRVDADWAAFKQVMAICVRASPPKIDDGDGS